MANNIYLIGFMGVGKSAVARELHKKLDLPLIEMDQEIVDRQGMEISEIFARHGEAFFRGLESALIREIANGHDAIVSCGGGAVLREENVFRNAKQRHGRFADRRTRDDPRTCKRLLAPSASGRKDECRCDPRADGTEKTCL